mgnify:CR=1 FL=1
MQYPVEIPGINNSYFLRAAYNAVRNNQQWIDVEPAYQAVRAAYETEQALGSQANRQSLRYLEGLMNDLQPAVNGNTTVTSAENLAARAQRLSAAATEAFKRKNSTLGTTLSNAANAFKGSVPGLREADVVYTRQNAINDIFGAVRKGKKVEAIDALLTDPKKGARVRNAMADDELRDIRLIASRMVGSSGSEAGMLKTMADTAVKSFLANPNGLTVFRHAFGPRFETLTPERMAGLMTFIRAYNAQTAGNED